MTARTAFTLVELSIVLVIIGLLTGGVLTGQSLIRASELRAVIAEHDRDIAAIQTFRDKYFALPGDMTNATAYWGKDNTNCPGNTGTATTAGTCNGNGDGTINIVAGATVPGEMFAFWQHLANAGLIEGSYTGLTGPDNSGWNAVPGTNVPRSRINSSGGWSVLTFSHPGDTSTYAHDYGNMMSMGGATSSNFTVAPLFKPEEAYNIDTKLDDGKPASGKLWARDGGGFTTANSCTTSTSATDYAGSYALSHTGIVCTLWFPQAF